MTIPSHAHWTHPRRAEAWRYLMVAGIFGLGVLVSIGLSLMVHDAERARLQAIFADAAGDYAQELRRQLRSSLEVLYAIRNFYASSREVERGEFATFTRDALRRHPEILALDWVPRVAGADRAVFEQAVRAEGFPAFEVTEQTADRSFARAEDRPEHYPILFIEPFEPYQAAMGFDMGSEARRRQALEAARDAGECRATEAVTLVVGDPQAYGWLAYLPIYRNGTPHEALSDRRANLQGFAMVVFRLTELFDSALKDVGLKGMAVSLHDDTEQVAAHLLYHPGSASRALGMSRPLQWQTAIDVAGRRWRFAAESTPRFLAINQRRGAVFVLGFGLLMTVLATAYLGLLLNQASKVDRLVKRRTAELITMNDRLQQEVGERLEAEAVRHTTELRYETLVREAPDPIVILDAAGQIQALNPAAERISGYAAQELLGKHFLRSGVLSAVALPKALQEFTLVVAGQQRPPFDLEIIRKDQARLIMEVNPHLLKDDQRILGIQIMFRDVTQRRAAEQQSRAQTEALERINAELARREQVTRSLLEDLQRSKKELETTSRQVQQANQKLQQLALLKDEFVAKVSHELRTPLTSIKEGLGLLLDNALGATTDDQQEFLATMDGDIDRLTELINNMLDISKIEAGRMRLSRARVDPGAVVASIIRSHQPLLGRRTVKVEGEEVPALFADRDRVIQILTNFLSNAMKVTDDDGAITVRLAQHEGMVSIGVQDDGPGMSSDDLGKLFEKFSQVGAVKEGRPRGTGLGLVVCKELTELHGGRIEVASEPGRGSTFTVHLPIYTDEFVLTESFRELRELLPTADGETVCAIAIAPERQEPLDRLAEEVRQRVHRGDIIFAYNHHWVVLLGLIRPTDLGAIVKRLRQALGGSHRLGFGAALYPGDGDNGDALLHAAAARIEQPLPKPGASA